MSSPHEGPDRLAKRCSCCRRWKAQDNFSPDPKTRDGFRGWCKQCTRLDKHQYTHERGGKAVRAAYDARPEVKERRREWAKNHPEVMAAAKVAWKNSPRGRLFSGRNAARTRLRRAATDGQREGCLKLIAAYDAEIARLDRGHELPEAPKARRAEYGSQSAHPGVYLKPSGAYEVKVSDGGRIVHGGTHKALEDAVAAAEALRARFQRAKAPTTHPIQRAASA